jgi:hypothetical protein
MSLSPSHLSFPRHRRALRVGPQKKSHAPRYRPEIEAFEGRYLLSASLFYSVDGTGNNLAHPDWGAVGQDLLRTAPPQYADDVSALGGVDRPSPRLISDVLVTDSTDGSITNSRLMSDWVYAWGQFLDHDIDLTSSGTGNQLDSANIPVPLGDPYFDPNSTGTQVIDFNRSEYDPLTGTGTGNPRQQINDITAFIDGSVIYGSDAVRADALRTHQGGKLKTSAGNLLPFNTLGLSNANSGPVPDNMLFLAGDVRANENIELTAVQTLFVREHNRIADQIHAQNPRLNDEQIYQYARAIVTAEEQAITFNEFLPALLGPDAIPRYTGYRATVNPGIANEFSTAAFRFGHSLLAPDVQFLNPDGTTADPSISLADAFFNPVEIEHTGVDPILKYLATDNAQEVDNKIVPELQNFLFGPPGAGGFDLASLNIQRGRDHGLADYNTTRWTYGLAPVTSFAQITSNVDTQAKLEELYGDVDNIDLWVGGLAEDHAPGSSVGPLFQRIIANQFQRLRDGDRLWYQNVYSGPALDALQHVTLAQIIARNTVNHDLQADVFFFKPQIQGTVFDDANHDGVRQPGEPGVAGRTIELIDDTGEVVAQTATDSTGHYLFNIFSGLGSGAYTVVEILPDGVFQTTADPQPIKITRGEVVSGVDFGNSSVPGPNASLALQVTPGITVETQQQFAAFVDGLTDNLGTGGHRRR